MCDNSTNSEVQTKLITIGLTKFTVALHLSTIAIPATSSSSCLRVLPKPANVTLETPHPHTVNKQRLLKQPAVGRLYSKKQPCAKTLPPSSTVAGLVKHPQG